MVPAAPAAVATEAAGSKQQSILSHPANYFAGFLFFALLVPGSCRLADCVIDLSIPPFSFFCHLTARLGNSTESGSVIFAA